MQTRTPSLLLSLAAGLSATALALLFVFAFDEPWTLRGDNKFVIYPLKLEMFHQWLSWHLPAWTNGMWSGYPMLANPEAGAFYAPLWLGFLLTPEPHVRALDIGTALHTGVLAAGTVGLLGALGCRAWTALFGAVLTVIAPQVLGWTPYVSNHAALAWWPWLFWAASSLGRADGPILGKIVAGSLPLGLQVVSGYPEMALYSGVAAGAWILASPGALSIRDRLLRTGALVLVAALLAAPQLLPTAWEMLDTSRIAPSEARTALSLQGGLGDVVDPRAVGRSLIRFSPFLGAATLALAATALLLRAPRSLDLAVIAGVAALGALGDRTPIYDLLSRIPLFGLFRGPVKLFLMTQMCVIWLAALGLEAGLARAGSSPRRLLLPAALATLSLLEYGIAFAVLVPVTARGHTAQELPLSRGLAVVDSVAPFLSPAEAGEPPPRVFMGSVVQMLGSLPMVRGIETLRGGGVSMLSGRHGWMHYGYIGPRHLDQLGVSRVLELGSCREPSRLGYEEVVGRGDGVCLLRNPTAQDRYALVSEWSAVESEGALVERVRTRPGLAVGVLAGAVDLPPSREEPVSGHVAVRRYRPGAVDLDVRSDAAALLLVRESWSPGWHATVDGVAAPLVQAAGIFFALPVEAGPHRVELRFRPPGVLPGLMGFGLWGLLAGVAFRRRAAAGTRRARAASAGSR